MSSISLLSSDTGMSAVARSASVARETERILDLPDGRIAYTDVGTGPLVVVVPGLGDVKEEYRFLAPKLVAAGYRVVAMDLRGHGKSSLGWPDYSSSAIGGDILALVRHLDAGPATIVGTSMGACAAAWAAAEAPEVISALALIGPFVRELPVESWMKNAKLLRGSFTMIEGAGHYPHAELPDATVPVILDFLAGEEPR